MSAGHCFENSHQMRTPEITREFRDKCNELAQLSNIPQVKLRLLRLAARYDRYLKEIDVRNPMRRPTQKSVPALGRTSYLVNGMSIGATPAADGALE